MPDPTAYEPFTSDEDARGALADALYEAPHLVDSGTTKHGQARRTGYRLIQEAPDAE